MTSDLDPPAPAYPGTAYQLCKPSAKVVTSEPTQSLPGLPFIMALPPGPAYLLWLFPYFLIPSAAVYVSLRLLDVLTFNIQSWLVIAATVAAQPTIFLFNFYLQPYRLDFYINTGIIPTIHDQCIWDKPHQPKNHVN